MGEFLSPGSEYQNWKAPEQPKPEDTQEKIIDIDGHPFALGQPVKIRRSSGEIEMGRFGGYFEGRVLVTAPDKTKPGREITKLIRPEDFLSLQEDQADNETNDNGENSALRAGNKELYAGDAVIVLRSNGAIEDWRLASYGKRNVVVEKDSPEGLLRKVVPVEEFIGWQTDYDSSGAVMDQGFGGDPGRPRIQR